MERMAGQVLGLDLNEGVASADLADLKRFRGDKMIPATLRSGFYTPIENRPERSFPGYEMAGAVQPPETYGA